MPLLGTREKMRLILQQSVAFALLSVITDKTTNMAVNKLVAWLDFCNNDEYIYWYGSTIFLKRVSLLLQYIIIIWKSSVFLLLTYLLAALFIVMYVLTSFYIFSFEIKIKPMHSFFLTLKSWDGWLANVGLVDGGWLSLGRCSPW